MAPIVASIVRALAGPVVRALAAADAVGGVTTTNGAASGGCAMVANTSWLIGSDLITRAAGYAAGVRSLLDSIHRVSNHPSAASRLFCHAQRLRV